MKNLLSPVSKKETGGALTGIIIIIIILITGGFYFYRMTKMQAEKNRLLRERAAQEESVGVPLDASVQGTVDTQ